MDIKSHIEARIREAGMTKKEFAARMGAHAGSLNSMLEAPSWPTLERVAKALGCDVPQLFSDAHSSAIICPQCGHEIKIKVEQ